MPDTPTPVPQDLPERIARLETLAESTRDVLKDLKLDIAKLDGRMDKLEGRIEKLIERVDGLGGRVENLSGQVSRLPSTLQMLTFTLTTLVALSVAMLTAFRMGHG
jgi:predicted nuclease with TOPRIM domain